MFQHVLGWRNRVPTFGGCRGDGRHPRFPIAGVPVGVPSAGVPARRRRSRLWAHGPTPRAGNGGTRHPSAGAHLRPVPSRPLRSTRAGRDGSVTGSPVREKSPQPGAAGSRVSWGGTLPIPVSVPFPEVGIKAGSEGKTRVQGSRRRGERLEPRAPQAGHVVGAGVLTASLGGTAAGWEGGAQRGLPGSWQLPPVGPQQLETALPGPWRCRFQRGYLHPNKGLITGAYTCCEALGWFDGEGRTGPGLIWGPGAHVPLLPRPPRCAGAAGQGAGRPIAPRAWAEARGSPGGPGAAVGGRAGPLRSAAWCPAPLRAPLEAAAGRERVEAASAAPLSALLGGPGTGRAAPVPCGPVVRMLRAARPGPLRGDRGRPGQGGLGNSQGSGAATPGLRGKGGSAPAADAGLAVPEPGMLRRSPGLAVAPQGSVTQKG